MIFHLASSYWSSETNWTLNATVGQIASGPTDPTASAIGVNKRIRLPASRDSTEIPVIRDPRSPIPNLQYPIPNPQPLIPASQAVSQPVSRWPIWQGCLGNCLDQVLTNCQGNLLAVCQERVPVWTASRSGIQILVRGVEVQEAHSPKEDSRIC